MIWSVVMQVFSTVLELLRIGRLSDQKKDQEILVLRKQLAISEQQVDKPVRLSRAERLTLVVINAKLKTVTGWSISDVIRIPYYAPNANAFAERRVRTVRDECLHKLIIVKQAHLRRVMREFVAYHNAARPHQGLDQQIPVPHTASAAGPIRCRNILGGIIHDYYPDAA
jgi:hypothetical protein